MPRIKSIFIERSGLTGTKAQQRREAARIASAMPGRTQLKNMIVGDKTIEFPQKGYTGSGRVEFAHNPGGGGSRIGGVSRTLVQY